jgi:hypothetical protein
MTRTIEQILGLPPMNQFDLVASPMYPLFTDTPNLAPWSHVPALIPLDTGMTKNTAAVLKIGRAWELAKVRIFKDKQHKPDSEDPYTVNHLVWYEATGFKRPYPGEDKVRWPSEFATQIAHSNFDLDD